ncbi:3'-5' exoribonuclease [Streptomyces sp. TRM72054]|uniref:3'-5' exoribonuclease n=1 Tax=Streptomyces sp. TRM72054 TaxID=2870562 RepID=UPI001C8C9125|nr:3'-5' exoribonuclease [Streptomyces sp. TRM72054]MBX9392243.1 3'-5' exoribonuclease [Streptomyces sp. TRM72054]
MRVFYDTEFIDDGKTIDLISIGMVREDGRELYAVSSEFNSFALLTNPWLRKNVWPSLPTVGPDNKPCRCPDPKHRYGSLDRHHPDVRSRAQIARLVADFILNTPDPQLWAYYAAYDHVALAQLWGPMSGLPDGIPMQTDDLVTEAKRLGLRPVDLPEQPDGLHNALADARHNLMRARFMDQIASR